MSSFIVGYRYYTVPDDLLFMWVTGPIDLLNIDLWRSRKFYE